MGSDSGSISSLDAEADLSQRSASFRDIPELSEVFDKTGYDENRQANIQCKFCKFSFKSNAKKRLSSHISTCKKIDVETKQRFRSLFIDDPKNTAKGVTGLLNCLITNSMVANNIPFKFVECKIFRKFLSILNPSYNLPHRFDIRSNYVPHISDKIKKDFIKEEMRRREIVTRLMTM